MFKLFSTPKKLKFCKFYSNEPILKVIKDRNFRVAIIGRPNTGKSTLYNKIVGGYHAIVDNQPGVTVDCQEDTASFEDLFFTVIDTPGADNIDLILEQTKEAIKTADIALVVTDFKEGITPWDKRIANFVLTKNIPALHILNKCDEIIYEDEEMEILEEHSIGMGKPIPVSAETQLGFQSIYQALKPLYLSHELKRKFENTEAEPYFNDREIRLAIIGQTNVGKSTMVNQLIGKERVLVSDIPGTTRDTIQVKCMYKDRSILLCDTAGLRKDKYIENKIEEDSLRDSLRTIKYANVIILVVDSQSELTQQDLKIATMTEREGRGLIIAANKWDLISEPYRIADTIEKKVTDSLSQIKGIKVVVCSSLTGKNIELLINEAINVYDKWNFRITTGELNRFVETFLIAQSFQPQNFPKIHYITQVESRPPTFAVFFARAKSMPRSFERQLINAIREKYQLDGIPFRIIQKPKGHYKGYEKDRERKAAESNRLEEELTGNSKNKRRKLKKEKIKKSSI